MAQRRRHSHKRQQRTSAPPRSAAPREAPPVYERRPPTQFGKPFILMEDQDKNTFEFAGGAWVAHSMSIAECRESCQVKELPQKVNGMTRYEIRRPLPTEA